jgi:AraC-like DNA-binding protein
VPLAANERPSGLKGLARCSVGCSEFVYSLRLDHAAYLLRRRALLGSGQPLGEIAYACGFRDYAHFARRFRNRFGYPPGAHAGQVNAPAMEPCAPVQTKVRR